MLASYHISEIPWPNCLGQNIPLPLPPSSSCERLPWPATACLLRPPASASLAQLASPTSSWPVIACDACHGRSGDHERAWDPPCFWGTAEKRESPMTFFDDHLDTRTSVRSYDVNQDPVIFSILILL